MGLNKIVLLYCDLSLYDILTLTVTIIHQLVPEDSIQTTHTTVTYPSAILLAQNGK